MEHGTWNERKFDTHPDESKAETSSENAKDRTQQPEKRRRTEGGAEEGRQPRTSEERGRSPLDGNWWTGKVKEGLQGYNRTNPPPSPPPNGPLQGPSQPSQRGPSEVPAHHQPIHANLRPSSAGHLWRRVFGSVHARLLMNHEWRPQSGAESSFRDLRYRHLSPPSSTGSSHLASAFPRQGCHARLQLLIENPTPWLSLTMTCMLLSSLDMLPEPFTVISTSTGCGLMQLVADEPLANHGPQSEESGL
ncbi:hypothetical protein GQ44DRAFT_769352 [Phaeosphaeriaceae sp. PMI808]|nr:hypothetical protein GQ44DRAFT_769352 [Phaeosphaeriaceae sp. PMI808]